MPEGLVEQATWESEQYSIPVGVHRGNGFWYNKTGDGRQRHRGRRHDVGRRVLRRGRHPQGRGDSGACALAMKERFQGAQTFENTLLGVVGPETYNALFRARPPGTTRESETPQKPMPGCSITSTRTSRR